MYPFIIGINTLIDAYKLMINTIFVFCTILFKNHFSHAPPNKSLSIVLFYIFLFKISCIFSLFSSKVNISNFY